MKTTLDLPDELVRRVKMRAVQSDRKLKDMVAALLDAGLRAEPAKIQRAVDLLKVKIPIRTVARFVKVSPSTVLRWKKKLFRNFAK